MSSSNYFQALLGPNFKEGEEKEVTIDDIDGPTLNVMINFCYTGRIEITKENVMRIVAAASAMQLVRVEQEIEQFWCDSLATSNCLDIFSAADQYSFKDLRKKSFDFICENFEALAASELQKIKVSFFSELLKCDQICAREEFIFQRLTEWAGYHETTRSKHVPELFKSIRLEKITQPVRWFLWKLHEDDHWIFHLNLQFLLEVVEPFARKYECMDLVLNEYRRRTECNGKSTDLYRNATDASKCIFALSSEPDVINVEKYNPISNRWDLFRNITVTDLITKRDSFGLVFDKDIIVLIGGKENQNSIRKVCFPLSRYLMVTHLKIFFSYSFQ